jgi:hypothetical protein
MNLRESGLIIFQIFSHHKGYIGYYHHMYHSVRESFTHLAILVTFFFLSLMLRSMCDSFFFLHPTLLSVFLLCFRYCSFVSDLLFPVLELGLLFDWFLLT